MSDEEQVELSLPLPPTPEELSIPLTVNMIPTQGGIVHLGLLAARLLLENGDVCFFITADKTVEACPLIEVFVDALPESEAIQQLIQIGYDDEKLSRYLDGRDSRMKVNALQTQRHPAYDEL